MTASEMTNFHNVCHSAKVCHPHMNRKENILRSRNPLTFIYELFSMLYECRFCKYIRTQKDCEYINYTCCIIKVRYCSLKFQKYCVLPKCFASSRPVGIQMERLRRPHHHYGGHRIWVSSALQGKLHHHLDHFDSVFTHILLTVILCQKYYHVHCDQFLLFTPLLFHVTC